MYNRFTRPLTMSFYEIRALHRKFVTNHAIFFVYISNCNGLKMVSGLGFVRPKRRLGIVIIVGGVRMVHEAADGVRLGLS